MRRRRSAAASPLNVLTLAVGAMLAGAGDADAMDCSRASTSAEWTICGDKNLLLLDRDLTIVYHKFIKVFSDTRHYTHLVAETRTGQKEWLRKRNACGTDAACIKAAYEKRLALLQSHVCYPRDDSPIYQKPAPVPKPVPQSAPQPNQSQGTASDCTSAYKVDWSFMEAVMPWPRRRRRLNRTAPGILHGPHTTVESGRRWQQNFKISIFRIIVPCTKNEEPGRENSCKER